jgi:hypothetical protein
MDTRFLLYSLLHQGRSVPGFAGLQRRGFEAACVKPSFPDRFSQFRTGKRWRTSSLRTNPRSSFFHISGEYKARASDGKNRQDERSSIWVVFGGPQETFMPKEHTADGSVDVLDKGEGETYAELVAALSRARDVMR